MKKIKSILGLVLLAAFVLVPASAVLADNNDGEDNGSSSVSRDSRDSNEDSNKSDELSSSTKDDSEDKLNEETSSTESEDQEINKNDDEDSRLSEDHGNRVSEFAKKLLELGKKDRKIKNEVEDIAKESLDSSTSTVEAIKKENERSAWKTFLIGSDYKNLGKIRSELAKTDNLVEKLNVLASSTADASIKVQLDEQIKSLQDAQAKVKAFVVANESKFSLFGWFAKIFVK